MSAGGSEPFEEFAHACGVRVRRQLRLKVADFCNTGAGFTNPGVVYLPRHKQGGECMATGAFAQLTQAHHTPPPRPKLGLALPGLTTLVRKQDRP